MSLINRMLRDLSARQPGPGPGGVMTGIQLPQEQRPRGGVLGRLGMLALLVVAFTGLLWIVFGPRTVKIPQPRGLPAGAAVASEASVPEAAAPAAAPTLQMDTRLARQTGLGGAHEAPGRAWPPRHALVARGAHQGLLASSRSFQYSSCPRKNLQKVSLYLDFI
jgi:hypothetical protein